MELQLNKKLELNMKYKILFLVLFSSNLYGNLIAIVFQGNKHITERELYTALNLYKPFMYEFWKKEPKVSSKTATFLAQTIKNYYRSRGFFHAIVTQNQKNGFLEIRINEKSLMRVADVAIISKLDITSVIPFKNKELFDAQEFDQSKKDIQLFYANKGYCNTKVDAKTWIDLDTDSAYLVYDVVPNELCYFGEIKINPSKNIDLEIIKSFLYIKEDDLFSPYLISQSYKSLYAHEGISKAIIDTKVQNDNKSLVSITVSENEKPIRFEVGVGVSSDEGLMLSLGVKHRNLFKNLKTLSLNTRLTEIKQILKTNFDIPLANRNTTGIEIGFENEDFLAFKEKRVTGGTFFKQREIFHLFKESLLFDSSSTYASDDKVLSPEGDLFVLSAKLEWTYDTRDNLLNPTQGYLLGLDLSGSILSEISDASYYKYNLSTAYIIPFLPSVVAFKIDYGSLHLYDGAIPASYHFFAGGMNSNRAYGYRKLGLSDEQNTPIELDSILEMSAEYRFPLYGNFRAVVFSDTTFVGDDSYPKQGYYSAGLGLRYLTPIGPIAIDLGFDVENPLNQYAIHFHIGELF